MNPNPNDSTNELILDNRKLIVAFFLLIITCGAFFLIGFMEGKRQGQRTRADESRPAPPAVSSATNIAPSAPQEQTVPASPKTLDDAKLRSEMSWYDNVNRAKDPAAKTRESGGSPAISKPETIRSAPVAEKPAARVEKSTAPQSGALRYSIQVGAFQQSAQAEARAAALKAKAFSCIVVPPGSGNDLYLVKLGDFTSRADAVAMQLRLKKDGFSSFIKTNR